MESILKGAVKEGVSLVLSYVFLKLKQQHVLVV